MKKVLDIVPYPYLPFFSGGQKLNAQFLGFLGKETDLTVISTVNNDFSTVKTYRGLAWLKKPFTRYLDIRLIRKITSHVRKEKYDTIIWEHPFYAWLAWIVRRRTGIKTIFHTHNIEHQRFRSVGKWWWPILKVYERWAFRFADYIYFITEEDKNFATTQWKIDAGKCVIVTFGVDIERSPDKTASRQAIAATHKIAADEKLMLFNGLLSYKPNLDALLAIVNDINPHLLGQQNFRYKIIVCGKGLPESMNGLKDYAEKNVTYAGFVDDIETYVKAADIFLNPVQAGGGIKTKMVEAIGLGTTVIATETGATGIHRPVCEDKLVVVPDNAWQQFAEAIIRNKSYASPTPAAYYQHYYWSNIVKKALTVI